MASRLLRMDGMTLLDRLLPLPGLVEIHHVDLAAPPSRVWEVARHGDLARSPFVRALFTLRELPRRLRGAPATTTQLRLDDLVSTPERPGFQVLVDDPPREVAVGAIGRVWKPEIPFVHVADAAAFAAFDRDGWIKVAWALRVLPRGERDARLEVEVRVAGTDDASWKLFRRYFRVIGPGSRFIRRSALAGLARALGTPEALENERPRPSDALLPDAAGQITHAITIAATPDAIWPWLVQMGCRRAGFYSVDALDNGGEPSAREVHPELQTLAVGDVIPATADGDDGFEVLRLDRSRSLVLGGLFDVDRGEQIAFGSSRPARYWHVTWAFELEPLDATSTRLHVRARAAFSPDERLHVAWIRPVHRLMEDAQLRHLAARAEGRLPQDAARDVLEGISGAARMLVALCTPLRRGERSHWGLDEATAARTYPGDELVPQPRWMWTHAVEIDASAEEVWPWVVQIGADRAGFYSYQWLENVVGCNVRNAETTRADWEHRVGDALVLHPRVPALRVTSVARSQHLVAFAAHDEKAAVSASWAFVLEPIEGRRCRFVSRYRVACGGDLASRFEYGEPLLEPIGYVMDRRMLLGVKERVERRARGATAVRRIEAT